MGLFLSTLGPSAQHKITQQVGKQTLCRCMHTMLLDYVIWGNTYTTYTMRHVLQLLERSRRPEQLA